MSQLNDPSESQILSNGPVTQVRIDVVLLRVLLLGSAAMGVVFTYGFPSMGDLALPGGYLVEDGWVWLTRMAQMVLVACYIFDFWVGRRVGRWAMEDEAPDKFDIIFHSGAALGVLFGLAGYVVGWHLFEFIVVCMMLAMLWQLNVVLSRKLNNPGMLLPSSFAVMILAGAALLKLPLAVPAGAPPISWMDAFFTATSAVCVTGLIVRDTATQFTPFGQTVIGVLIQLGGLGMIIFGSMLAVLLGSRPSLRENLSLSQMLDNQPLRHVTQLVRFIVLVTIVLELAGAIASFGFWDGDLTIQQRMGMSLFHSVSAYCNAGFALYPNSLENYRYSAVTHMVIAPLIVLGGLGFPVLNNFWVVAKSTWHRWWRKPAVYKGQYNQPLTQGRLSLHTKVVLTTTACLYMYGMLTIFASQVMPYISDAAGRNVTANAIELEPLTVSRVGAMVADSSFMSITSRTAGFNSMPMEPIGPAGHVTMMTLMIVGGSPGGTSGGMKTTTLALIILSVWATVRQRQEAEAFDRRIFDSVIRRATALAGAMILLVVVCSIALCMTEPFPFMKLLFEIISAVTTTGLSLGITADLSSFGKTVIILAMFLGRVGPLALLGALVFTGRSGRPYALAHENVMLG